MDIKIVSILFHLRHNFSKISLPESNRSINMLSNKIQTDIYRSLVSIQYCVSNDFAASNLAKNH